MESPVSFTEGLQVKMWSNTNGTQVFLCSFFDIYAQIKDESIGSSSSVVVTVIVVIYCPVCRSEKRVKRLGLSDGG